MDITFLLDTLAALLAGVPLLLELVGGSVTVGAALAVGLALMRLSGVRVLGGAARVYVFVFRGTPLLVQIFLIYYGLGQFPAVRQSVIWTFLRQPYWCALLAFTLNTAAYGSEVVRGAIQGVAHGQLEAGRACGMSGALLFRRIVAPIALRHALPAYGNEIILMVKATSLASVITLMEVTGIAHRLISETYRAVEVFLCAGAIYLALNFGVARLVALAERRLSPAAPPGPGGGAAELH